MDLPQVTDGLDHIILY